MIREEKLDFWVKNGYNVLLIGDHGTGKTSLVTQAFERNNLKWKYFSASTLDPWVDFVGVPKEVKCDDGSSYLDLVRPKDFQYDEVEAIFLDEFSRSHFKVRNAVMELIQFKSINGKKFNNLKLIWAAINPEDSEDNEYDVQALDPAQKDRFHVHVTVPYQPDKTYFSNKYGKQQARAAITWWNELPKEIKKHISPRRLDYALDFHAKNGDLEDILPKEANLLKLKQNLKHGPIKDLLYKIFDRKSTEEAEDFLQQENNLNVAIDEIVTSKDDMKNFFVPLLPKERIVQTLTKSQRFRKYFLDKIEDHQKYKDVVCDILTANANNQMTKEIQRKLSRNPKLASSLGIDPKTGRRALAEDKFGVSYSDYKPHVGKFKDFGVARWSNEQINGRRHYNGPLANTNNRAKFVSTIAEKLPETQTVSEVTTILNSLGVVASRTNLNTLEDNSKFKDFIHVLNYCIDQIHLHTRKDFAQIRKDHLQNVYGLPKIFYSAKLGSKMLCLPTKSTSNTPQPSTNTTPSSTKSGQWENPSSTTVSQQPACHSTKKENISVLDSTPNFGRSSL